MHVPAVARPFLSDVLKMPARRTRRDPQEFAGPNKDERWWQSDDSPDEDGGSKTRAQGATSAAAQPPCGFPDHDPWYDPDLDDKDAKWADKARSGRVSDAILSCPGCFSTLTVDCQQHARHHNQFRAMLVTNCAVGDQRLLQAAPAPAVCEQAGSKKGAKKMWVGPEGSGEQQQQQQGAGGEWFHPVSCSLCGTEVGVTDADEVYHFFHVFPSNA